MSSIKNKSEIGGLLGESLAVRKVNGSVVVKNRPKRKMGPPSVKQAAFQEKFLEASAYAKGQILNTESKALYKAGIRGTMRSAYMVAMSDYLNAPEVKGIRTTDYHGGIGDLIVVKATDDFKVTKVKVIITDAAGGAVEQGEASQDPDKNFLWNYNATVAIPKAPANGAGLATDGSGLAGTKIQAIAFDRPGNETSLEKVL